MASINDYGTPGEPLNAPPLNVWAASVAAVVDQSDVTVNARISAATEAATAATAPALNTGLKLWIQSPTGAQYWNDAGLAWKPIVNQGAGWMPSVAAWSNLPASGNRQGDKRHVLNGVGLCVALWTGAAWVIAPESDTDWQTKAAWDTDGVVTSGSIPGTNLGPIPGKSGSIKIRRTGGRVRCSIYLLAATNPVFDSTLSGEIFQWVTGWRIPTTTRMPVAGWGGSSSLSPTYLRASVGDASLEVDYPQTVTTGTHWLGEVSWDCDDPWPTSI